MASITVKAPTKTISLRAKQTDRIDFFESMEKNISNVVLGRLALTFDKEYERLISVMAVFLQRLIVRTPLDDYYDREYVDKEGNLVIEHHKPDLEVCREHWIVEDKNGLGFGWNSKNTDVRFGYTILGDKSEIDEIKAKLMRHFPLSVYKRNGKLPDFEVSNNCVHFSRLEYGYKKWKNDTDPVVDKNGREHGVQNQHSVQAPVGMLRITQMELESIKRSPSVRPLTARYKAGGNLRVTPSDKKLNEFWKMLKKGKKLRYADIKRYVENY